MASPSSQNPSKSTSTPNKDDLEHVEILMENGLDSLESKSPSSNSSSPSSPPSSQMTSPTLDERDKLVQDHNISELLEKIRTDGNDLMVVLRSLVTFTLLCFIPIFTTFLYLDNFYDITKQKLYSKDSNPHMEFVRWGTVIVIGYDAYFIIYHLITNSFSLFHYTMNFFKMGSPSRKLRRTISYIVICRHWVTLLLWTGFIMILGSNMVYRSSYSDAFLQTVNTTSSSSSTGGVGKHIKSIHNAKFVLERLFIVVLVAFISIAIGRFSTEMLKIGYLRVAFEERVHKNNWAFEALLKLKRILSTNHIPGECKVVMNVLHNDREIKLDVGKKDDFMLTESSTRDVAKRFFDQILPPGVQTLTLKDIERYFYTKDISSLQQIILLDQYDNQIPLPLSKEQWVDCILQIFFKRQELINGLKNASEIISTFDSLMFCLSCLVTWCLGVPSLGLGHNALFVIIGILWAALGFLFQNAVKNIFEALIFVFIEHCFDVGDRVMIDNEYLTVFKIELFTTVFRRSDGTAIYMPNSVLANKPVINIRRSGPQRQVFTKSFLGTITIDAIQNILDDLLKFTSENSKDFTGKVDLLSYSGNSSKVDLNFMVEYASNFQNSSLQSKRSIMIEDFFEEATQKRGLELISS